jgi:hypothetical protein
MAMAGVGMRIHEVARVASEDVVCVEAGAELVLVDHVVPHAVLDRLRNVVLRAWHVKGDSCVREREAEGGRANDCLTVSEHHHQGYTYVLDVLGDLADP